MRNTLLYILLTLSLSVFATEYYFERITSRDGLSQNNVLAICKDSEGYMWFGTYDGLNKYDGYQFKVYRSNEGKNSLTSNLIQYLAADKNNNIWVGTFEKGLSVFNYKTERFTHFYNTPGQPNIITNNAITQIFCDSKGRVWVSTEKGLNCFILQPNGSYQITKLSHDPNNPSSLSSRIIQHVSEDSKGRIWVSTSNSLELLKTDSGGAIKNEFYHVIYEPKDIDIRQLLEVSGGYLVSYYDGVLFFKYNPKEPEYVKTYPLEKHPSFDIQLDKNGNLWTGGHNGLYNFKYDKTLFPPYKLAGHIGEGEDDHLLSNQFIREMYYDNNGILWLGTNGGGILKLNTQKFRFRHYKKTQEKGSLSHNKVFNIYEDRYRNVWIGTEGGGLNLLNKEKNYTNGFTKIDVSVVGQQNFVFDIIDSYESKPNELWVGTGYDSKLVIVDKTKEGWKTKQKKGHIQHQIMALCKDEYETIWAGSYNGGLNRFRMRGNVEVETHYNMDNSLLPSNIIRSITEDSKGRLWIGTSEGLVMMTREQKQKDSLQFTIFTHNELDPNSICNSYTVPVLETSNGEIWIGTFGDGIAIYHEGTEPWNGRFTKFDMTDGLPNNMIKSIIEDDNNDIWVTTNKGLSKIYKGSKKVRNFSVNDGLQDLEFIDLTGCKLYDGEILIGGVKGFNAFYPNEITDDTIPPIVVFNNLEIMNRTVRVNELFDGSILLTQTINNTREITLKHTQNNITIYYSAIHNWSPKGTIFKYKLEGFDKEWIQTDSEIRMARYTNINAGEYTFKVMAANSDGYWCKEPKTLIIHIKPPFWLTVWFQLTLIAIIILITTAIVMFRFYLIKKQNIDLEAEVSNRMAEILKINKELSMLAASLKVVNAQLEERQQKVLEQSEELFVQNEELFEHRNRLEKLVADRTCDLQQAMERAEESDRLKTLFLAIMSHEIRTPMNAIVGFSELMRDDTLTVIEREQYVNLIQTNSDALLNIIEDILDFSLIESNSLKVILKAFNICDLLDDIHNSFALRITDKQVEIRYNNTLENRNLKVISDEYRIRQILNNLMGNALKFTKTGHVELGATLIENRLELYVSDTAMGLTEEQQTTIFDRFVKHESAKTGYVQGVGLGLSISKSLAEKLGGELHVVSHINEGSKFTFTLYI